MSRSRSRSRASFAAPFKDDDMDKIASRVRSVMTSISIDSIRPGNNKLDESQNLLDKYNGNFADVDEDDKGDVLLEVQSVLESLKPARYEMSGQLEELHKLLAQVKVLINGNITTERTPSEPIELPPKKRRRGTASSVLDSDSHDESSTGQSASSALDFTSTPILDSHVAFRMRRYKSGEEEWIECIVSRVLSEGTRYEVQDPEPDDQGNPGQSYRANIKDLIVVPPVGIDILQLPEFSPGTTVLARYPDTTSFYRAEVTGIKKDRSKYRLKFEGEEEEGKETEVERRLVLPASK